ncbi:Methionyl-tRNA formyltransferase [Acaryochloris thomasi RCC1774]|uniref:Methionyl-tRNA formyltransferase n=1 Tax=Acaryochloris thomasi RCC1774 TaxID=1764569 RepID=A0A2W1JHH7_9CYAN|nr:Methionyl-tRNA formyltransferase [Acaryochloris thomasi RCC1774]
MIKLIFWGTPQFAVPSLVRLLEEPDIEVLGAVTQPDRRRGRGKQLLPSAVKETALKHGLPVWQPHSVKKDAETLEVLRSQPVDAFIVVAYGQILSPEILAIPRLGCINSHGSLLPAYRGAAPIQWALHDGQKATGLTTMLMDVGMDTGDMLLKSTTNIDPFENAHELAERLSQLSGNLLVETLTQLEKHTIVPIPQDEAQATYARLIKKDDFRLDWANPALLLHNQVRGFFPFCIASFRGQPLKITATVPFDAQGTPLLSGSRSLPALEQLVNKVPGDVVSIAKNKGPIIQTGEGYLLLKTVQLSGKKRQSGWDFANGLHLSIEETLENG